MKGPKLLLENEDRWVTDMGAWFPGERVVFRGKDLFHDLKDFSWMGLLLYGITGRTFDDKQVRLFEGIWTLSTSYPEPRLWNNRVAALAGTTRSSTNLGVSASIAVSEAIIYGHRPLLAAMVFLRMVRDRIKDGRELDRVLIEYIDGERASSRGRPGSGQYRRVAIIPGYGRPITREDERIQPLLQLATGLGYGEGPTVKLAFRIEDTLLANEINLNMNVAALMAALAADQELTPREFYHYVILCFCAGIMPCGIDSFNKPEGTFFPIKCSDIKYDGKSEREWSTN